MIPGLHRLPRNLLMRNPAGSFSFVGSVDGRLCYVRADGSEPTAEDFRAAQIAGPRIAGLHSRTWPTAEAARAEAARLGIEITEADNA